MRNSVSLAELSGIPTSEVANLSVEEFSMLFEELAGMKTACKKYKTILHNACIQKFADDAADERANQGKETGSVRLQAGDYEVVCDLPKDVDWDQASLRKAIEKIRSFGEPVEDYVNVKYSVPETKYNAWPESLKSIFAPARTVKTGKQTFKIERREK